MSNWNLNQNWKAVCNFPAKWLWMSWFELEFQFPYAFLIKISRFEHRFFKKIKFPKLQLKFKSCCKINLNSFEFKSINNKYIKEEEVEEDRILIKYINWEMISIRCRR